VKKYITVVLLLSTFAFSASGAEPFRIVFIAYQNPEQIVKDVTPVVGYLEDQLGVPVKYNVVTHYAGVVEALKNDTADMGFMGPLQYVMAHSYAGATPILGEIYKGKSTYTARIYVRKDSGIKTLKDLEGKSIAFTDPISSSGYLYPLELFKEEGLVKNDPEDFFKRIYFSGGDEQAIRAVYNGFVDAAGIGQFAMSLLRSDERDEMIYIGESRPLPSHCVVVRKGLPETTVEKIRVALLALQDGPKKHLLQSLYGTDGYVKVNDDTYAEVKGIAAKYGFLK
jgi:phosphonate transport system substrate-binding protein